MPHSRILGLEGKPSIYHCMSRTVAGEFLLDDRAKEVLRRMIWKVAEFCGVHVLTYAILDNHFHILVSVPDRTIAETTMTDAELIRRYRVLYPKPSQFRPALICVLEARLAAGGEQSARLRRSLLDRMHDLSGFMKTLKQNFSVWFNQTHERFGTLWADRFRSTLIEGARSEAMLVVAAYIDLNPVRAGIVSDPKDYRWTGYGEATAGSNEARCGIAAVVDGVESEAVRSGTANWQLIAADYRLLLFGKGAVPKEHTASISEDRFAAVVRAKGQLSLPERLLCRTRALVDGAVLGSQVFVLEQLGRYRDRTGRRQLAGPQRLPHLSSALFSLRGFPASG